MKENRHFVAHARLRAKIIVRKFRNRFAGHSRKALAALLGSALLTTMLFQNCSEGFKLSEVDSLTQSSLTFPTTSVTPGAPAPLFSSVQPLSDLLGFVKGTGVSTFSLLPSPRNSISLYSTPTFKSGNVYFGMYNSQIVRTGLDLKNPTRVRLFPGQAQENIEQLSFNEGSQFAIVTYFNVVSKQYQTVAWNPLSSQIINLFNRGSSNLNSAEFHFDSYQKQHLFIYKGNAQSPAIQTTLVVFSEVTQQVRNFNLNTDFQIFSNRRFQSDAPGFRFFTQSIPGYLISQTIPNKLDFALFSMATGTLTRVPAIDESTPVYYHSTRDSIYWKHYDGFLDVREYKLATGITQIIAENYSGSPYYYEGEEGFVMDKLGADGRSTSFLFSTKNENLIVNLAGSFRRQYVGPQLIRQKTDLVLINDFNRQAIILNEANHNVVRTVDTSKVLAESYQNQPSSYLFIDPTRSILIGIVSDVDNRTKFVSLDIATNQTQTTVLNSGVLNLFQNEAGFIFHAGNNVQRLSWKLDNLVTLWSGIDDVSRSWLSPIRPVFDPTSDHDLITYNSQNQFLRLNYKTMTIQEPTRYSKISALTPSSFVLSADRQVLVGVQSTGNPGQPGTYEIKIVFYNKQMQLLSEKVALAQSPTPYVFVNAFEKEAKSDYVYAVAVGTGNTQHSIFRIRVSTQNFELISTQVEISSYGDNITPDGDLLTVDGQHCPVGRTTCSFLSNNIGYVNGYSFFPSGRLVVHHSQSTTKPNSFIGISLFVKNNGVYTLSESIQNVYGRANYASEEMYYPPNIIWNLATGQKTQLNFVPKEYPVFANKDGSWQFEEAVLNDAGIATGFRSRSWKANQSRDIINTPLAVGESGLLLDSQVGPNKNLYAYMISKQNGPSKLYFINGTTGALLFQKTFPLSEYKNGMFFGKNSDLFVYSAANGATFDLHVMDLNNFTSNILKTSVSNEFLLHNCRSVLENERLICPLYSGEFNDLEILNLRTRERKGLLRFPFGFGMSDIIPISENKFLGLYEPFLRHTYGGFSPFNYSTPAPDSRIGAHVVFDLAN